jgi:hypothetical protein
MFRQTVRQIGRGAIVFAAAAVFLTGGTAHAVVIVDGKGFEFPDFSTTYVGTGQLEGQSGWVRTAGTGTADVQTGIVYSGDQAVQVDRAANSDDRWGVPVSGTTGMRVRIDWDMRVEDAGGTAYGPFLGVEAYDGSGLLGSLGVDATTADVLYQAEDSGIFLESGSTITFGNWNHFQIELDYSADEYTIYLNGSPLVTEGFVDRAQGLDDLSDADISAIAAGGDTVSQAQTGTATYDNFIVRRDLVSVLVDIFTATEIFWPTLTGVMYQVQYTPDLSNTWVNLNSVIPGSGSTTQIFDSTHGILKRYYRVVTQE